MPYDRVRPLGSGFFGEVWLEYDAALDRSCAAKYLNPAYLAPGHEFDEARRMNGIEHDNVVRIYSADFENNVPVLRMEFLSHGSVEGRYCGASAPVAEGMRFIEDACRGVEALHANGVLHRDIKPANLLITDDGHAKVSDFGLACHHADIGAGSTWAYPLHLPPEALGAFGARVIDAAAGDVYALGVTLYRTVNGSELLSAAAPTDGDIESLVKKGLFPDRGLMQSHVHPSLRKVIVKALHPEIPKRYPSAGDLRHALEAARPDVSWTQAPRVAGIESWYGEANGGGGWQARIVQLPDGDHRFELDRRASLSGRFRAVRADTLVTPDRQAAEKHAAKTLQRVAVSGR